jgi:hypothetical protein
MSFSILRDLPRYNGHKMVLARCGCGTDKVLRRSTVLYGVVKSCGCARTVSNKARIAALHVLNTRHGHRRKTNTSPTYYSWRAMLGRCYNKQKDNYKYYGAKGVNVCRQWRRSFRKFLLDMGERPLGTTLDRIDPSGNYEPRNCRWATPKVQRANRRHNATV